MHNIRKMHCQAIHIEIHHTSLPNPSGQTSLSQGLISLHNSEFASNRHPNVPLVSGPSVAAGSRNSVPAGLPSHGPCNRMICQNKET